VPNKHDSFLLLPLLSSTRPLPNDMLTRLPRAIAFTTRRGMATYRKAREPYNLKKKLPTRQNRPSFVQTEPRKYAPVGTSTPFGLRPPEKEPWKPDDDRFDTENAREVDKPIGGAPRQHVIVRPATQDGGAVVAGSETEATPKSHSRCGCQTLCWIIP
jgi:hypothetical protein